MGSRKKGPLISVLCFNKSIVIFLCCWAWLEMSSSCSSDQLNMQFKPKCRSWMFFCWSSLRHSWNSPNACPWCWTCLCCFFLLKNGWRWGRGESRICCLSPGPLVYLRSWCLDQLFSELGPVALSPWGVPVQAGRASLLPIPALHFYQCLFCKAGSFLLHELRVISPILHRIVWRFRALLLPDLSHLGLGWEWQGGNHQCTSPEGAKSCCAAWRIRTCGRCWLVPCIRSEELWLFEGQVPVLVRGWRNLLSASLWWVGLRCSPVLNISY